MIAAGQNRPHVVPPGGRPLFTVFTPSFNRAHTLERPYRSLGAQTLQDFEWIIVDDGSRDGTRELVEAWQKEARFSIRYFWKENGGKHTAFNLAVHEAQGELFLTLDSDDECVPTALERFRFHWFSIPGSVRSGFSAVTALCIDEAGDLVGDRFPSNAFDCSSQALRYRYKVKGEKWGFQRTDVLRQFPFPEPTATRFVPEGIVWRAISRKYKTRYVNEVLRVYHMASGPDQSLSTQTDKTKHAIGEMLDYKSVLNDDLRWFPSAPMRFAMTAILYAYNSWLAHVGIVDQYRGLRGAAKILWILTLPAATYKYGRDRFWRERTVRKGR